MNPIVVNLGNLQVGVKGFIKAETVCSITGKRTLHRDWFPNRLLTAGLNAMGLVDNWMDYCQVGASSAAVNPGDTGLYSWIAGTNQRAVSDTSGAQGVEPWYGWLQRTYRFPVGVAAGNVSEIGFGWADGAPGGTATLVARQLIVDGAGDPDTFPVQSTEYLDITYQMRYYPPLTDVVGTTTIDGVLYDVTTRAANVNSGGSWGSIIGQIMKDISLFNTDWTAHDGTVGEIWQGPNGIQAANDNDGSFSDEYQGNTQTRTVGSTAGSTGWVLGNGIRSMMFKTTGGQYQSEFSSNPGGLTIPKTTGKTLQMKWTISWAEKVLP